MTSADRRIAAIATGQLGAFSRIQAHDAGLSDRQLRGRVQSGFLVPNGPNAFRSAGAPTSLESELRALVLDVGEPVWVSGLTAAALHGFDDVALRRPFHLHMPNNRSVSRFNLKLHRTDRIDPIDRCEVRGLPVLSPARTLVELARKNEMARLAAWIDGALRDGLVSEDLLHRRIVDLRARGRHGLPALLDALVGKELTRGGDSWLEREYLRLLHEAGLPRPDTQVALTSAGDRVVRVDCRFPGTRLVVELLGYRFHRTKAQMSRDAERMNALQDEGLRVYQFTYDKVTGDGDGVIATTERLLAELPGS